MGEDEGELLLRGSAPDGAHSGIETTKRHDDSPITMGFLVTRALAFVPGGDDACLSPQAALMVSGTCLQIASRLRTRFLLHERDIRLERQGGAIQSLDRKLLDPGGAVPDVKLKARRLHDTGHPLACHLSSDVVLPVIDAYASIGLHGAGKGLLVHPSQPAVRIHHLGHGWQGWKLGTSHTRWPVATGARLVGTLAVVMNQKRLGEFRDLRERAWPMDLQTLLTKRAVKSLDIRIQIGSMRGDDIGYHPKTEQEPNQGGREIPDSKRFRQSVDHCQR